ncbi:MAG: ERF family protein [Alphaproteobacteria bacterium]|nr:ERF family protein [Alphaproteobacteria bacterium]
MPEVVAGAVNAVMSDVKRLLKSERNRQAGYKFASIDDFLAAVNPLCAEAGLIILQDELDARLVNDGGNSFDRSWLWTTFTFTLAHKSGAIYGPLTRSVMVPARGAQAFGSAQSYALKQFMRSLFQIPTGDKEDADFAVPARLPVTVKRGTARRDNGKAAKKNGSHLNSGGKRAGGDAGKSGAEPVSPAAANPAADETGSEAR